MQPRPEFIEKLILKYERYVAPVTFVFGFVFDTLTLRRLDLWFDHIILLFYTFLAMAGITILNSYEAGKWRSKAVDLTIPFVPILMQFAFGGLFSAFVIFYTKSAAFGKSWLFLTALTVLLVGNERFRKNYQRLVFQLNVFFVVLFSYSIFAMPLVLKKIGTAVFLWSGLAGLAFITLFIFFLSFFIPSQVKRGCRALLFSIGGVYLIFNLLYFTNIIPPIPLSLKEGGVYHSVRRLDSGEYELTYEPARWRFLFQETNSRYHWKKGEPIYFFSSVFAPTQLNLVILHQWSYYDEGNRRWIKYDGVKFPIIGGRDGGYRGYSYRTGIQPGRWMVEIMTEQGQIIGQNNFVVVETDQKPQLAYVLR